MAGQILSSREWQESISRLIDAIGSGEFYKALLDAIGLIAECDTGMIVAFEKKGPPVPLFDRLQPRERKPFFGSWLSGAYIVSPLYNCFVEKRPDGFYTVRDLVPKGFRQSEYYRSYFRHLGAADLGAYLVWKSPESAILVTFGRLEFTSPFSREERLRLNLAGPVIRSATKKHCQSREERESNPELRLLHEQFAQRLQTFGDSSLTAREREVVRLILRGHSTKSLAWNLGISPETARVHRQNIYRKLGVASQSQLFISFISYLLAP